MPLSPEDVVNKRFNPTRVREGYAQDEVDDFLDEVVGELRRLTTENEQLRQKAAAAERQVAELSRGVPAAREERGVVVPMERPAPVAAPPPPPQVSAPVVPAPQASPVPGQAPEAATGMLALAQKLHDDFVRSGEEQRDRILGEAKDRASKLIREAGLPLTANFVVHRQNLERLPDMLALGEELGASRIEIAHVQYYGWGLVNRAALMPTRAQLEDANAAVAAARAALRGRITIDYVVPDYYAARPKACMGGWGRRLINVTPTGRVLPCHAAETIPGLEFWSVRDHALGEVWAESPAFAAYRGTGWMVEPCGSCPRRTVDFGGCRCQALALTGDARNADPVCHLSPFHGRVKEVVLAETDGAPPAHAYRGRPDAAARP